ncbi:hypothetical protein KEJ39_06765 [Candidatus Bathyarchaeota archaeon]|nr:hypothetical protein [Candidatus Bathyarchaeota archaeon]
MESKLVKTITVESGHPSDTEDSDGSSLLHSSKPVKPHTDLKKMDEKPQLAPPLSPDFDTAFRPIPLQLLFETILQTRSCMKRNREYDRI